MCMYMYVHLWISVCIYICIGLSPTHSPRSLDGVLRILPPRSTRGRGRVRGHLPQNHNGHRVVRGDLDPTRTPLRGSRRGQGQHSSDANTRCTIRWRPCRSFISSRDNSNQSRHQHMPKVIGLGRCSAAAAPSSRLPHI